MDLLFSWLRIDVRRNWRSLVALGLLVAIATSIVLASVAGARRGSSALDRLLAQTLPATVLMRPSQPVDSRLVRDLPQVAALTTFSGYTGFGVDEAPGETVGLYVPADDAAMRTVERPAVLAGRLADPSRRDEAVVTEHFVNTHDLGVGDRVTLRLFSVGQVDTGVSGVRSVIPPRPLGPTVKVRIVGVIRSTWFSDSVGSPGELIPSPGLFQRYRENITGASPYITFNMLVRLHGGARDLDDFRRALAANPALPSMEFDDRSGLFAHTREVVRFESGCLLAFGLCALVVGIALVGQAVVRSTSRTVVDLQPLRSIGMQRRQLIVLAGVVPALVATLGAGLGCVASVVASSALPFGAAADVEPAPGLDVDAVVLVTGWLVVPMLVYAGAALAAAALLFRPDPTGRVRSSAIAELAARVGAAVPVLVGLRFAFEPDRVRGSIVIRPAVAGAVLGVVGVVAAVLFAGGVTDAAERPERFGQRYQGSIGFGYNGMELAPAKELIDAIDDDPDVLRVADTRFAIATTERGSLITYALPVTEHAGLVLREGEPPGSAEEILLAPKAAERLGAGIGSTVRLDGEKEPRDLLVTGIGFVPESEYNAYSDGAVVTPDGYDELFTGFLNHVALVSLRPGADRQELLARLHRRATADAPDAGQWFLGPLPPPQQLAELRDVRLLPIGLGAFLGLFAVSAVAYALTSTFRQRRRELGVLRALGMTPSQSRGVMVTQASALALVGVLVGVPLGVVLGRLVWRIVAELMPVAYVPPPIIWVLVSCVPVAVVVANLLAVLPGERAARLRVGQVLRAE